MDTVLKSFYLLFLLAIPATVSGQTVTCKQLNVKVQAYNNKDAEAVCSHINKGQAVLASMGIKLPSQFTVTLSHELPKNEVCQMQCYGFFDVQKNTVYLLDYEQTVNQSRKSPLFVKEVMTPTLWGSYIVHELTHVAIRNSNVSIRNMCLASEYIASVAQMEALPHKERDNIIGKYGKINGFNDTYEISQTYYSINPGMFIVKAYLHYHNLKDKTSFMKQIKREGLSCDTP